MTRSQTRSKTGKDQSTGTFSPKTVDWRKPEGLEFSDFAQARAMAAHLAESGSLVIGNPNVINAEPGIYYGQVVKIKLFESKSERNNGKGYFLLFAEVDGKLPEGMKRTEAREDDIIDLNETILLNWFVSKDIVDKVEPGTAVEVEVFVRQDSEWKNARCHSYG